MYEKTYRDRAGGGTATVTNWSLTTSGDGSAYLTAGNWSSSFSSTRYLKQTFDPGVPSGATITSASVSVGYRSNSSGDTACWYVEVYSSSTLIGTHGSSGSPVSCNTGNTTYKTDVVSILEVDGASEANNLAIKVYMKESGSRKTQIDLVQGNLGYYLN